MQAAGSDVTSGGAVKDMRRKDREITLLSDLLAVIKEQKVCRLGLCEYNQPYIVPLNYGCLYEGGILSLFFHSAHEGKKIAIIRSNNRACFEIDCDHALVSGEKACDYSFAYTSVMGAGIIEFITAREEKILALNRIVKHQSGKDKTYKIADANLNAVTVYKLTVNELTGKRAHIKD